MKDLDTVGVLSPADTIAYAPLFTPGGRSTSNGDAIPVTAVRCGRPLVYRVPADALPLPLRERARTMGWAYLGAVFAFDLDELDGGQRYVTARFAVTLDDDRAVAVALHADGDAFGLAYDVDGFRPASALATRTIAAGSGRRGWLARLLRRAGGRATASGLMSHDFAWRYADPHGDHLLPRLYAMHVLIEIPAEAPDISGRLSVDVGVAGGRQPEAGLAEAVAFRVPITAESVASAVSGSVRLVMAVDVSGYSRQSYPVATDMQRHLVRVTKAARHEAGLAEDAVDLQPQGDGQFAVLPSGIDETVVIPQLLAGLAGALRSANRELASTFATTPVRLRLRVSLHRGFVRAADNGWIGNAAIAVHRLLDSPPLRAALSGDDRADWVLAVPDVLFDDVITHATEPPPGDFVHATVDLPEKGLVEGAWIYVGRPDQS